MREHDQKLAEQGAKAEAAYRKWHRTLGFLPMTDVDHIEYRFNADDSVRIVALIDTSAFRHAPAIAGHRHKTLEKKEQNGEAEVYLALAAGVNVDAYLVVHDEALTVFHVTKLDDIDWSVKSALQYRDWLHSL